MGQEYQAVYTAFAIGVSLLGAVNFIINLKISSGITKLELRLLERMNDNKAEILKYVHDEYAVKNEVQILKDAVNELKAEMRYIKSNLGTAE